jgi:Kef-type K+ transport system membrane component KefB
MALLWVLVVLLILFAIVGGIAVNHWLLVILVVALLLLLIGVFSPAVLRRPSRRCRRARTTAPTRVAEASP